MRTSSTRAVATVFVAAALAGSACTMRSPGHGGHHHGTLFGPGAGAKPAGTEGDAVSVDADSVSTDSDQVEIDLGGKTVTAKRDSVIQRGARSFSWFGRTPGRSTANVQVTVDGDNVAAHVDTDDGAQVATAPAGKGAGLRTRLDPGVLKEATDPESDLTAQALSAGSNRSEDQVSVQAAGDTTIDVMIVYNSTVMRMYSTAAGVKTVAQRMIDKANKSFTDSGLKLQYRLVYIGQVADAQIAKSYFSGGNLAGVMRSSIVANLRNQYGADLVQAWGNFNDVCGQGYQPTVSSTVSAGYGFSVINASRSCTEGQAVSHELGHNIGGGHDRVTSRRPTGGGDAYGLVDPTHRFLTIMAYPQNCGSSYYYCTQSWLYSSPNVRYNGYPTGVAGSVDNVRNMAIIGPRVAAFRAPKV